MALPPPGTRLDLGAALPHTSLNEILPLEPGQRAALRVTIRTVNLCGEICRRDDIPEDAGFELNTAAAYDVRREMC